MDQYAVSSQYISAMDPIHFKVQTGKKRSKSRSKSRSASRKGKKSKSVNGVVHSFILLLLPSTECVDSISECTHIQDQMFTYVHGLLGERPAETTEEILESFPTEYQEIIYVLPAEFHPTSTKHGKHSYTTCLII